MEIWAYKGVIRNANKAESSTKRYKRNYDKRLRRDAEKINPGDQVYLRVERRDEKVTQHKIEPIALAPASNVTKEVQEEIRPLTINEVILDYPVPEGFNQTHIHQQPVKHSGRLPSAWETIDQ